MRVSRPVAPTSTWRRSPMLWGIEKPRPHTWQRPMPCSRPCKCQSMSHEPSSWPENAA